MEEAQAVYFNPSYYDLFSLPTLTEAWSVETYDQKLRFDVDSAIHDDIEITHGQGQTVIRGVEREKVREFRECVKTNPDNSGSLTFRGVKKIDVLRPGSDEPQQTIYGEPGEPELARG
jgi:hypothetical protein